VSVILSIHIQCCCKTFCFVRFINLRCTERVCFNYALPVCGQNAYHHHENVWLRDAVEAQNLVTEVSGARRKFSWRGSFSGISWPFSFSVRSLWRHNLTSYSCFETNVLAKCADIIGIFFYTPSPYCMCHCTRYKISALQVGISDENKLSPTTQLFITAKISGCALKQGSKTHSSLRQSNLQWKNQAALMSCRIRALEYRRCASGLAGALPVCKIESC